MNVNLNSLLNECQIIYKKDDLLVEIWCPNSHIYSLIFKCIDSLTKEMSSRKFEKIRIFVEEELMLSISIKDL